MRVIVTGGAGFIGSHLTDAFLGRGDDVATIDDLSAGPAGRVDGRVSGDKGRGIDAGSLPGVILASGRPELICHLAARSAVRASVAHPPADAEANVIGTINVLEAARTT